MTQKAEVVSRLQTKTLQIGQMLNNLQKFNHLLTDDNQNRNSSSTNFTPFSRLSKVPQGKVRHNWQPYNDPKTKNKKETENQNENEESDRSKVSCSELKNDQPKISPIRENNQLPKDLQSQNTEKQHIAHTETVDQLEEVADSTDVREKKEYESNSDTMKVPASYESTDTSTA